MARGKFKVGDMTEIVYAPRNSGFYIDDHVRVLKRLVNARANDKRPNRYFVATLGRSGDQIEGWLDEGDLGEPVRMSVSYGSRLRDQERPSVLGYELHRSSLTPVHQHIDTSHKGDYGADPVGDGTFKMVPSGDIVDYAERNRRLGRK